MKPWGRIAFWIVVAAQLVFLIGFIVVKEADLRIGTEVVLQTVPVDPRSLLQGDYAILDYEIARLPSHLQQLEVGDTVYVGLRRGPEIWTASGYTVARSDVVEDIFIKGRVDRRGHADFGIGTYFVPEGTGHIVERADDVKAVVNVDGDGNAAIKDLLVDGEPFNPNSDRQG